MSQFFGSDIMKLEAVIFDMDGTLLDTQREAFKAWNFAGEKQGIAGVGDDGLIVCGMNEEGWSNFLVDKYPHLDIIKFKQDMWEYLKTKAEIRTMPGMFELLGFLKENNLKLGIASGTDPDVIKRNMKLVGAVDYFQAFAGGADVKNGKPAPDVFLLAAERLGVNPENCVIFEDSSNGILAGHRAGMKCIGVPDMAPLTKEAESVCWHIISRLDQAIEIIKKEI